MASIYLCIPSSYHVVADSILQVFIICEAFTSKVLLHFWKQENVRRYQVRIVRNNSHSYLCTYHMTRSDVKRHEGTFQYHTEHQKPMIGCNKTGERAVCTNVLYFLDGPRIFSRGSSVSTISSHRHFPNFIPPPLHAISYSHSFILCHPSPHSTLGKKLVWRTTGVGKKGVIRRGRTMRRTLFHTNWKHLGSFHCCCHFVFLFRSYIPHREWLDLTAVLCLVHLKVLWLFLIISPINLFQKFFSLYFAICVIKPLH